MMKAPAHLSELMQSHRSIRQYQDRPVEVGLIDRVLHQALAGSSSSGNHFGEREVRGRERYLSMGPEMAALWAEHGIESLAQYYTSKIKYDPDRFADFSEDIHALLRERGFHARLSP
jgi:nitroreductase